MHVGRIKTEKPNITYFAFKDDQTWEKETESIEDCKPFAPDGAITWINVDGISDIKVIEDIGTCFSLHPLLLEDVLNTEQRPKVDDYGNYLYIVLRIFCPGVNGKVDSEQVSIVLGQDYVISFQEKGGTVFDSIRERIRNGKGRIRQEHADYIAYSLIDNIVDGYFEVLEILGEKIDEVEESLVTDPSTEILQTIHHFKRQMIYLRKSIWPMREVINSLTRAESALINKSTIVYLRDVYDHTIQVIDTMETYRDTLASMIDIYLSSISNRMNEVMKVLTIIATLFIPLTFVVGVYGMNFKFMPELEWAWGYYAVWAIMAIITGFLLSYFHKKRWI